MIRLSSLVATPKGGFKAQTAALFHSSLNFEKWGLGETSFVFQHGCQTSLADKPGPIPRDLHGSTWVRRTFCAWPSPWVLFDPSKRTCGNSRPCRGLLWPDKSYRRWVGVRRRTCKWLTVPTVPWHNILCKRAGFVDGEGAPIKEKRQDVILSVLFLRIFQHSVELLASEGMARWRLHTAASYPHCRGRFSRR